MKILDLTKPTARDNCPKDLEKYDEIILTLEGRKFVSDLATDPVFKNQLMCREGDSVFLDYPPEEVAEKSGWSIFTLSAYREISKGNFKLIGQIPDVISYNIDKVSMWDVSVYKEISEETKGTLFKPKLQIKLKKLTN